MDERTRAQTLAAECEALKIQLAEGGQGNEKLTNLVQEKQSQIERLTNETKGKASEIEKLTNEVREKHKEIDFLKARGDELHAKAQNYEAEIEKAKKSFDTLKAQAKSKIVDGQEKLKVKVAELAKEKADSEERLKTQEEGSKKEKEELMMSLKQKREELNILKIEFENRWQAKEIQLEKERKSCEVKEKEKTKLIEDLTNRVDSLNAAVVSK